MIGDGSRKVSLDLGDLQHLYFTLHASVHEFDDDTGFAILAAQEKALAALEMVPGIVRVVHGSPGGDAPPVVGTTTENPLLAGCKEDREPVRKPLAEVVYGVFARYEGFAFLEAGTADALVREIGELQRIGTLGELRTRFPSLEHVHPPIDPAEDDWPYEPDTTSIDLNDYEDWPPFPPYHSLRVLPAEVIDDLTERAGAEWHFPVMDGEFMVVPVDREAELLAVLERHGIRARRDDQLIAGLGE